MSRRSAHEPGAGRRGGRRESRQAGREPSGLAAPRASHVLEAWRCCAALPFSRLLSVAALGWLSACGSADLCGSGRPCDPAPQDPRVAASRPFGSTDEDDLPAPVAEAGFVEIEPVAHVAQGQRRESGRARLFYSLLPADDDAKTRPVLVLFNGGPGAGTMHILHAFGTGPTTLPSEAPAATVLPNPASFTRLGSLLYIDARGTGFSYGLTDDPSREEERAAGLGPGSLGLAFDAADFVRVVLRVLLRHPALRNNPVVLVGESYGATRAALMASLLLHPQQLQGGYRGAERIGYTDETLAEEIRAHYAAVFPETPFAHIGPEIASQQFGRQVLVQPAFSVLAKPQLVPYPPEIAADCSEGSPMRRAAAERGETCPLAEGEYDPELYLRPAGWRDALFRAAQETLLDPSLFEARFGVHPARVEGLSAVDRAGAFRFASLEERAPDAPLESEAWTVELGTLLLWDQYFLPLLPAASRDSEGVDERAFHLFLEQAPWVETLITDAYWDVVFPSRVIPEVIAQLRARGGPDVVATYDGTERDGEARPGWLTLRYGDSVRVPESRRDVQVRMPRYDRSGHALTVTEGPELLEDVEAFFFGE